jgi:hypothetical protein
LELYTKVLDNQIMAHGAEHPDVAISYGSTLNPKP